MSSVISDRIINFEEYISLNKNLKKAFEFLKSADVDKLLDGRYEIDGENVFALVQSYRTKAENEVGWEAHKKYIDIQFIAKGTEAIGWKPADELTVREGYSEKNDIAFYENPPCWSRLVLTEGQFAVFFPSDAHKPCLAVQSPCEVKKIVVKVKL